MAFSKSAVPSIKSLTLPVLSVLGDRESHFVDDIVDEVIAKMNLNPAVKEIVSSSASNKSQIKYNIEWALDNLKNKGLVESPIVKQRKITNLGIRVLNEGIDINSLNSIQMSSSSVKSDVGSFFDLLESQGILMDTSLVEDFLLSLKSKQFMILSGGTGTGKTKIAQLYGQFISHSVGELTDNLDFDVTITDKFKTNRGFTLNGETIKSLLPNGKDPLDGQYMFSLLGYEGIAKIDMTPRIWFEPKAEYWTDLVDKVNEVSKTSKKAILTLRHCAKNKSGNYEIVPVGSNWMDARHILGYRNAISGDYIKTQSLNVILSSNSNCDVPYFLILDEMNLSHVERYFSDIISAMESHEPISLDSSDIEDVPDFITLGDNLFIIGTVNMDETTYSFSPKVLDRANVIEFEPSSISDYCSKLSKGYNPRGNVEFLQNCMEGIECREMKAPDVLDKIGHDFSESFVRDLDKIQSIMKQMNFSFGFRTVDEICRFMYVAWIYEGKESFNNWKRYFDSQIRQRILPKIHGNSSILNHLKELQLFCNEQGYFRSAIRLKKMTDTLETQRYVSFNC